MNRYIKLKLINNSNVIGNYFLGRDDEVTRLLKLKE